MKVFILYAHPEPEKSFNGELLRTSIKTLEAEGHEVRVSDLYQMQFNPVASEKDFLERRFPDRLQYDREQKHAVKYDALTADIVEEIEKVMWCDLFIVQFPLYWFSMPAIMKGWFDRVFANSLIYGAGKRMENGGLKGKKAMVCLSTGAEETMFKPNGLLGDINITLWPIHGGIFWYTGMEVLEPFVAWNPVYQGEEKSRDYFNLYAERLKNFENIPVLPNHPLADFDNNFQFKDSVRAKTVAHKNI